MNILFLCHRIPFPPDKGEKIRAYHMLAHLAREHTLHLGAFVEDPAEMRHAARLREMIAGECHLVPLGAGARVNMVGGLLRDAPLSASYFKSGALMRWTDHIIRTRNIQSAIVFSTAMAPYLLRQRGFDLKRVIFDMVDVDSDKWRQYAASAPSLLAAVYRREMRTLFALERQAASSFGGTLLVSPHEVNTFAKLAPDVRERLWSVPNGVDLDFFTSQRSYRNPFKPDEYPIVMTGTMDYRPNVEGALWFAKSVLPLIISRRPEARFYAVGARPNREVKKLGCSTVVITGQVDDVRPYLAHAKAVVAPLKLARGVQNKVLEAMAMAKPVIATSPATQALDVASGEELLVADEPAKFADSVLAAIDAPSSIGMKGRLYVERHHQWTRNFAALDHLLGEVLARDASEPHSPFGRAAE
jgi:sugar transferase (PEP-CTERM/EpsH1 system associated)